MQRRKEPRFKVNKSVSVRVLAAFPGPSRGQSVDASLIDFSGCGCAFNIRYLVVPRSRSWTRTRLSSERSCPEIRELARESKALVALAFRNGPIEDMHAGETCPAWMVNLVTRGSPTPK